MSKILIVHAHPEPKSLTSALKNHAAGTLEALGHTVQVSDLYQSGWKAVAQIFRSESASRRCPRAASTAA